ncbi:hypothetical protein [Paractinoplanes durhamensis]|uniref:Uncharacterized protein n=1 Tax=Paractinoplanes durhamensis TaxID=113563 RepID=A0ABQ3ZCC0_9ACTN|nr:hypothetical protein [Actinoplanes durhamensis]GIE07431.1 hypothetical protein Adu01nite_87810 [Actinoplanes durhamensis]
MTEQQSSRRPIWVITLVVLALLTVGTAAMATVHSLSGLNKTAAKPAAASGDVQPSTSPPTIIESLPSPIPTTTPAPTRTGVPTGRKTTTTRSQAEIDQVYTDMPRKPVGASSKTPDLRPSYQEGVEAEDRCAPKGALGHTEDGTLMTCGPAPKDNTDRWRVVIPPPTLPN